MLSFRVIRRTQVTRKVSSEDVAGLTRSLGAHLYYTVLLPLTLNVQLGKLMFSLHVRCTKP